MDQDKSAAEWVSAYLEWIDAAPGAAAADDIDAPDFSREQVLLMALRTEADCVHMLRQVLEAGSTAPGTLRVAIEGLEDAQRLLEGERRAWRALGDIREEGWTIPQVYWPGDLDREWPAALESIAADVRALADKVLTLQTH